MKGQKNIYHGNAIPKGTSMITLISHIRNLRVNFETTMKGAIYQEATTTLNMLLMTEIKYS